MKITDQVIFDAHKMTEIEFLEYYTLYWNMSKQDVGTILNKIKIKIKSGSVEVVTYLNEHYFRKSSLLYFKKYKK